MRKEYTESTRPQTVSRRLTGATVHGFLRSRRPCISTPHGPRTGDSMTTIDDNAPPRVVLAHSPTPLEEMPHLAAALAGTAAAVPSLYVKRDDCTGLALGGNKARQLEYYLGQAVA